MLSPIGRWGKYSNSGEPMGIHLSVKTTDGLDYPEWDWIRHAGDRDFVGLDLPRQEIEPKEDLHLWRPTDVPAWRAATAGFPNPDRFAGLLDLLESKPELWLYVSW